MSPAGVQLRRANAADLAAVVALERSIESAPHWPPASYAAIIDSQAGPRRCLFVAETLAQGEIVGFAVGLMHPADGIVELESVAVAKSARRAGIARALCAAVFDWSREQGAASVTLEVRAGSTAALALYAALGFTIEGRRPRYYRDPEDDALLLRLPLTPARSEPK